MVRLKVALDVQAARRSGMTGHGYYIQGLLDGLRSVEDVQVIELAPAENTDLNSIGRYFWDQLHLPSLARRAGADVLHSTCFSVPRRFKGGKVATIHDLSLRLFPQNMRGFSGWFLRSFVPSTYGRADHIIAISQATKTDAVRLLGLGEDRVTVVHEAASSFYTPAPLKERRAAVDQFGLTEGRFILFVGTIEPRKNLAFLVRSLAPLLRKEPDLRLVIAGKLGWQAEDVKAEVAASSLEGKVIFTGYIDDVQKRALYSCAGIFCFPSLYEGFGLPPLEAASCGSAVAVADNSSLPEVVGDAGLVLALEEGAWMRACERVLSDSSYRAGLAERALARAGTFSWEKTARETAAVYRKALA